MIIRSQVLGGIAFITLMTCFPCAKAAGPMYTIRDLGTLGGTQSQGNSVNNSGQVTGWALTPAGDQHAFLWNGTSMLDLGTFGGPTSVGNGINSSGQIAGYAQVLPSQAHPFIWSSSAGMRDIGQATGSTGVITGINDLGHAAGYADTTAFFWNGTTMALFDFGIRGTFPQAINNVDQMTGYIIAYNETNGTFFNRAFFWNGTSHDLGVIVGRPWSTGYGINNAGHITGVAYGSPSNPAALAFLWNGSSATDVGPNGSVGQGINNLDQVVGYVFNGSQYAYLWDGTTAYNLKDQLVSPAGWTELTSAQAINDVGQITGYGIINGQTHAFLLTPVGTISVATNLPSATFTISGPVNYSGSGTSASFNIAPPGTYTISYSSVACYGAPSSQTITLNPGGLIAFNGTYRGAATVSVNITPAAATSATFSISPPIPGMPSNGPYPRVQPNVWPQPYTLTFNPVGTFQPPAPQTASPSVACTFVYTGTYTEALAVSVANLSIDFKLTATGSGGGFKVFTPGVAAAVAIGTRALPSVQLPAPATYIVTYDDINGYHTPPQQTVILRATDSLTLTALYRRLILVSFTGWNDAPNPSQCLPIPLTYTVGSGIRYDLSTTPNSVGMIAILNTIQHNYQRLASGTAMAGFTFYSTDAAGSNACSTATNTDHIEARNWFNTQAVTSDDMIAVVGHSYGGNRARQFVGQLKASGYTTNVLATVDPIDWDTCTIELVIDGALSGIDLCNQSQSLRVHSAKKALSFHQVIGVAELFPAPILKGYTLYPADVFLMPDYHADVLGTTSGIAEDSTVHTTIINSLINLVGTPPASPVAITVIPGTPSRGGGNITIPFRVSVTGSGSAASITIMTALLNGVGAGGMPVAIGSVPSGSLSHLANLVFPGTAAVAGATVQLTIAGQYSYYNQQPFTATFRVRVP